MLLAEICKVMVLILSVMGFVDEDESCSGFNCRFLNNQVSQDKMEQNSPVTIRTIGLGGSAWQCMRSVSCELQAAGGRL